MIRNVVLSCILHLCCIQGLQIYIPDAGIENIDPDYFVVDKSDLEVIPENDTFSTLSFSITFNKDNPENIACRFSVWQYSLGEYVVPGGFDFKLPLCEMMDEPVIMGKIMELMGLTKVPCPPPAGTYGFSAYYPPSDMMPDSLPGEKYMVRFEIYELEKQIFEAQIFVNFIE